MEKRSQVYFEVGRQTIDKRFTQVKVWIAHTGRNLNKSNFSKEMLSKMINSLEYTPIVGFVKVDENNNKADFAGHEERYILSEDGVQHEYLGRMYGFIPKEHNAKFELKTVDGVEREYLVANGLIANKFPYAKEILDRDVVKHQSMELIWETLDGTYVPETDEFMVTNAEFDALCFLGDNHRPAMVGGAIEKYSFKSIKNELFELIEEFKNYSQGGKTVEVENVEVNETTETTEESVVTYSVEDYNALQAEVESLKARMNVLTEEIKGWETAFELLEADKNALAELNSVNTGLLEQYQVREKTDFLNSVSNLTNDEKSALLEKVTEYSFEDFKVEITKVIGAKLMTYSTGEALQDKVFDVEDTSNSKNPYAGKSYAKYIG